MTTLPELTTEIISYMMAQQLFQFERDVMLDAVERTFIIPPSVNNDPVGIQDKPMPFICVLCSRRIGATKVPVTYRECNTCSNTRSLVNDKLLNFASSRVLIKDGLKKAGYHATQAEYLYLTFVDWLHTGKLDYESWAAHVRSSLGVGISDSPRADDPVDLSGETELDKLLKS